MSTKMTPAARKVQRLTRILEALELELLEASDEEILQAAKDLGMDPRMKGSAAFLGLKFPAKWQLEDFFAIARALQEAQRERAGREPRSGGIGIDLGSILAKKKDE